MAIINKKRDKGSLCLIPLCVLKKNFWCPINKDGKFHSSDAKPIDPLLHKFHLSQHSEDEMSVDMIIRFLNINFTKNAMLSLSDSRINCFISCQHNIHYLSASNSVLSSMKREKRQILIIQYLTTLKASHAVFFRSSRGLIFNTS